MLVDTAALIAENHVFGELLRNADFSTAVPTCPGWSLEQLMRHVGRGDRWCAQMIINKATEILDPRTVPEGKPPADRDAAITWLHDGVRVLIDAMHSSGEQTLVWTFLGPRPAQWWIRRRLYEVVIHRIDAALALGLDGDALNIDPELAAGAVTEWLERVAIQVNNDPRLTDDDRPLMAGQVLHLHTTDSGVGSVGHWTVRVGHHGMEVEHVFAVSPEQHQASVTVRGSVRDVLLALVRRKRSDELDVDILGDAQIWQTWLAHTPF